MFVRPTAFDAVQQQQRPILLLLIQLDCINCVRRKNLSIFSLYWKMKQSSTEKTLQRRILPVDCRCRRSSPRV